MLLKQINCLDSLPADSYCEYGDVRVVNSLLGSYREAGDSPLSRFVYRFSIEKIGCPHLAVVRYPDDKRRFMLIGDGTSYDLSTGVITGHSYPVSGKMQELRQVFWPRWTDCTIAFMTWGHGEPAAAASIEIHELDDLPALDIPSYPGGRELGIQYEDCCGTGASEGAQTFSTWLDHLVTYAKHTGQNLLSYPICWYHGPFFPSRLERADAFSIVVTEDRGQYIAWTDDPPDWPEILLERFDQEGLEFQGVITLLRLSSVMKHLNADLEGIRSGAATVHNMLWNNEVQAGTMDWTSIYNTVNYTGLLKRPDPISLKPDFDWAYGEKSDQTYREDALYRPGPIFNPLHPVVQTAIIAFVREIAERYGKHRSFKGIALTMWAPTMIWFGSLHSGYDDFTIGLFEQETGVRVPVDPGAPDRFSKRYDFLIFQCRDAWIDWRCGKIRDLICKMRDALNEVRSDLRLTLNLWSEPFVPAVLGSGKPEHQIHARPGTQDLYREAGLDIHLLEGESNIECDLQIEGGGRDRSPSNLDTATLEHFYMFRDHDFLDQKTLDAVACQPLPGAFIFNAWHEAWGKHLWFPAGAEDPNLPSVAETYGRKATGAFRINSKYPDDGFWWDSELRISPAFPPTPHFMEQYAHALAELDACRITRGGLFLDKAHGEEVRRFARAYRALPRKRFETVGTSTDPVAVRSLHHGDHQFFYLVNREHYPVSVTVMFSSETSGLQDLSTAGALPAARKLVVALGGYELRSFRMDSATALECFQTEIPEAIRHQLVADAQRTLQQIAGLKNEGVHIPGFPDLVLRIQDALAHGQFALLRRLLTSYPAAKASQLTQPHPET